MSEEPSDFRYSQKALDEDEYAESAAITLFPTGTSLMPVTAGANWGSNTGEAGLITTKSTGVEGVQIFEAYNGSEYKRSYTSGSWGTWAEGGGDGVPTIPDDTYVEADLINGYPLGISQMFITFGGPGGWVFSPEDFTVMTHHYSSIDSGEFGIQFIHRASTPMLFSWRTFDGIDEEWSGWRSSVSREDTDFLYYDKTYIDALEDRIEALETP